VCRDEDIGIGIGIGRGIFGAGVDAGGEKAAVVFLKSALRSVGGREMASSRPLFLLFFLVIARS
jgi:hypothetical protein